METLSAIRNVGVLPVIELPDPDLALPLGEALQAAELPAMEITFRAAGAEKAIRSVTRHLPNVLVGAGTVLSMTQLEAAIDAGARFVVSPGFDPKLVERALAAGVLPLPGVATPTEVQMGLSAGLTTLKFFPAEQAGGVRYLQALGGPFRHVAFVPTGGINERNLRDYLAIPSVAACGGSWFVKKDLLAARDFESIAKLAQAARSIVSEVRQ